MSKNTLVTINKVAGTLATVVGGAGATVAYDTISSGTGDTATLIVEILTSFTSIVYGLFSVFKKKTTEQ